MNKKRDRQKRLNWQYSESFLFLLLVWKHKKRMYTFKFKETNQVNLISAIFPSKNALNEKKCRIPKKRIWKGHKNSRFFPSNCYPWYYFFCFIWDDVHLFLFVTIKKGGGTKNNWLSLWKAMLYEDKGEKITCKRNVGIKRRFDLITSLWCN